MVPTISGLSTAATLQVGPDQYYKTIQSAVNASADGDTIYVDGDVYPEYVTIDKPLTLIGLENGTGGRPMLAHPYQARPVMEIASHDVVVDSFDFRGGDLPGTPYDNRSHLSNNTGIWISGCGCAIRNVSTSGFAYGIIIEYCDKTSIGALSAIDDSVSISRSNISSNRYGMSISFRGNVSLFENDFTDNSVHVMTSLAHDIHIFRNNFYPAEGMEISPVKSGPILINTTSPVSYVFEGRQCTSYMGNYWGNYTGRDDNFDGIGDVPYIVGVMPPSLEGAGLYNYRDNYPAIAPMSSYSFEKDIERLTVTAKPDLYGGYPPASLHVLHVGPGQVYSTIQRAVNVSIDGDTVYVHGEAYPEAVVIDKQINLIGVPNSSGGRPILKGWPTPSAFESNPGMDVTSHGVIIDGFEIQGDQNSTGIRVTGNDCIILNVTVSSCRTGVELGADNISVTRSVLSSNIGGVKTHYASNVIVARNDFIDNQKIAFLSFTSYATFFQNNFINNSWGVSPSITNNVRINTTTPVPYTFRDSVFTNLTGNFWSNNTAVDDNRDGIADTPYTSWVVSDFGNSWNFTDDYPAVGRWSFDNSTATIGEPALSRRAPTAQSSTPAATPQESGSVALLAPIGLLVAAFICGLTTYLRRP